MKKKAIVPIVIAVAILALCIGILQFASLSDSNNPAENAFEQAALQQDDIVSYTQAVEEMIAQPNAVDTDNGTDVAATSLPARVENNVLVIGRNDAPVTILEFSSLSCPHCATFHTKVLGAIKKDYVDTGKVKIIFNDFPLNQQALHGTLLLKCVDGQDRYALMEMLFEQQAQWAFEGDHQTKLKQYAALLGLSNEKAETCMADGEQEKSILQTMKLAAQQYNIASTPSFVILPEPTLITGSQSYGAFSTEIEKRLGK